MTRGRRTSAGALQPLLMTLAFEEINLGGPALHPEHLAAQQLRHPVSLGQWRPRNFEEIYPVQVTLAAAFALSQNIATSVLMDRVGGPRAMRDIMKRFNIHLSKEQVPEPGLSLGQTAATPFSWRAWWAL